MLSKSRRLSRPDFLTTQKLGHRIRTRQFSLVYYERKTNNEQPARFAVVTSSKFHKHAVVRNRFRRRIYDLVSRIEFSPADYLIIPSRSMLDLKNEEIISHFNSLLPKIHLL